MVIGIIIGAIIVAIIWMCVYFNQEIHDVRAEGRARNSTYRPGPVTYMEGSIEKKCAEVEERLEKLIAERKKYEDLFDRLNNKLEEGLMLLEEIDERRVQFAREYQEAKAVLITATANKKGGNDQ